MSQLVPKRAKLSRPSGQWQNEDYDVLADPRARTPRQGGSAVAVERTF